MSSSVKCIPIQNKYDRVVVLVDMDCFYCQVEEKLDPTLKGKPLAVVQYNAWRGGGIIAVNYAARDKGVTRHMRGDEAKEQCPDIQLVKVPNVREKADLSKYRDAGKEVANVLQRFTPLLERASVDEAYLDITEAVNKRLESMNEGSFVLQPQELINTYAVGYLNIGEYLTTITTRFANPYVDDEAFNRAHDTNDVPAARQSDIRLLIGASIASEIRSAVKAETTYECSAGIAHNKILAKLVCGINKPNKQTIMPLAYIPSLFETLPVGKITGLGGKFGVDVCERLNVRFLGQLLKFTEAELQRKFDEKNGTWLYNMCRGIDLEAVTPRFYSKSIGCCKKFPGRNNITGLNTLKHWLNELGNEISERLEKDIVENNRRAKQMVVNYIQEFDDQEISSSRSAPLLNYDQETLAKSSFEVLKANTKIFFRAGSETVLNNPIKFLGISVGKFETITNGQNKLQEMFANQAAKKKITDEQNAKIKEENQKSSKDDKTILEKLILPPKGAEAKMKSFFTKYLQSKKESSASPKDSTPKVPREEEEEHIYYQNEEAPKPQPNMLKQPIEEQPLNTILKQQPDVPQNKPDIYDSKIMQVKESTSIVAAKSKSFFYNAIQKQQLDKSYLHKRTSFNENDNQNGELEDIRDLEDDTIKLEKELQLIDDEDHLKDDINNTERPRCFFENTLNQEENNTADLTSTKRKFEEISVDEEQINVDSVKSAFDYQANYAEFAIPELRPEHFQYTKCEICGAKISTDACSVQLHQDHHFAQQLSQQQRNEFRQDIKTKIAVSKTPPHTNKKMKKSSASDTSKTFKSDITKFLRPTQVIAPHTLNSNEPSTSLQAEIAKQENETELCKQCNVLIRKLEMPEHIDFHVAKELQRKLNQLEVRTVAIIKNPSAVQNRLNGSTSASSRGAVTKPITKFFSQPNF